jgi:hypothetical protein
MTRIALLWASKVHSLAMNPAHCTSQQAVMECACDAKTGESRGHQLWMTTACCVCFCKFLAAQLPPSPQRTKGRSATPKHNLQSKSDN